MTDRLFLLDLPLFHKRDPQTSVDAADRAAEFAATHEGIIYGALVEAGPHGATSKEVAYGSLTEHTQYEQRNGCAIWFRAEWKA